MLSSMLSSKERRFVLSPATFSPKYQKVIRSRVRKRINTTVSDLLLCLQNQKIMGIDVDEMLKDLTNAKIHNDTKEEEPVTETIVNDEPDW